MGDSHGNRFDGQLWYEKKMDERTKAAMKEKEEAFIKEHANDSDSQLLAVIRNRARELGHSPRAVEVIGAGLICERFGSWAAALTKAGLGFPTGAVKLRNSRLYHQEYIRQQELYRAERDARKERERRKLEGEEEP